MVVVVVADVERVLVVAGHGRWTGTVQLTSVEIREHRCVGEVDASDAAVVVVHGDVQHTAAHFHRDRVAVGHVVGRISRVGRPGACAVAVRNDALLELSKVVEFCTAHDQVGSVGPQFIEDVTGVARQAVACFPRAVPRVGVFVVASDALLGGEHGFTVVLHNSSNWEFNVVPRIDERL